MNKAVMCSEECKYILNQLFNFHLKLDKEEYTSNPQEKN